MKHPVDAHVGKRIRHRRWMVGMTQQQLADKVGIKFQQIQKYETGMNRVSASRLWDIADALGVTIGFFFEGIDDSRETAAAAAGDFMADKEALELVVLLRHPGSPAAPPVRSGARAERRGLNDPA